MITYSPNRRLQIHIRAVLHENLHHLKFARQTSDVQGWIALLRGRIYSRFSFDKLLHDIHVAFLCRQMQSAEANL